MNARSVLAVLGIAALFFLCLIVGVVTDVFNFGVSNTKDFVQEQQPGAKSAGELIGKQYSQLRDLSVALDNLACQVQLNENGLKRLGETYGGLEINWPSDARAEARGYRTARDVNLQLYSTRASEYNALRTDIRTLPDNIPGLEVDKVPQQVGLSPLPGMCGSFALPAPSQ